MQNDRFYILFIFTKKEGETDRSGSPSVFLCFFYSQCTPAVVLDLLNDGKAVRGEANEMPDAHYGKQIVAILEKIYAASDE